jgi:hypothetical protein
MYRSVGCVVDGQRSSGGAAARAEGQRQPGQRCRLHTAHGRREAGQRQLGVGSDDSAVTGRVRGAALDHEIKSTQSYYIFARRQNSTVTVTAAPRLRCSPNPTKSACPPPCSKLGSTSGVVVVSSSSAAPAAIHHPASPLGSLLPSLP